MKTSEASILIHLKWDYCWEGSKKFCMIKESRYLAKDFYSDSFSSSFFWLLCGASSYNSGSHKTVTEHHTQPVREPQSSPFPIFMPSFNPLPLSVGWIYWFPPHKQNRRSDVMSLLKLSYKGLWFGALPLIPFQITHPGESWLSYHTVFCGKSHVPRAWGLPTTT